MFSLGALSALLLQGVQSILLRFEPVLILADCIQVSPAPHGPQKAL